MIPKVKEEYPYFDDGKIRRSRMDKVIIKEVVAFGKADKETKEAWLKEVEQCPWLYKAETDYFVKGKLVNTCEDAIFVRTLGDDWFSLGWWAGRLDLDGSLISMLES